MFLTRRLLVLLLPAALLLAACGDDDSTSAGSGLPTITVTTNILGDVVADLVGDRAEVVTIMPVGANPHDFQASARQVNQMREADVLIVNGGGFEQGLLDLIEEAEADGVTTYEAISATDTLDADETGGHDDDDAHDDETGGHDDDAADHEHAADGADPHFFTDPVRMAQAVEGIAGFLTANVAALDDEEFAARVAASIDELRALDAELETTLSVIPEEDRVLVTNHEVFGYFADRYGFEVVGTVIPAASTSEGASGGALSALAAVIREEGVPAIFADTSSADRLASTLADEVGDVAVVELFSESLGEAGSGGETYLDMMRSNARRIVGALA